jgi:hypothetical protein
VLSSLGEGVVDGQSNSGPSNWPEDAFITKFNADGTKAWTKFLGTSGYDKALALSTGLDGSIYISGRTTGTLDGQANSGAYDVFLTKFLLDGTKAWTKLLGTSKNDMALGLATGLDGSIYISGQTEGALDGQSNKGGWFDAFLTKFNSDGTKAWTKLLGTTGLDTAYAITIGLDGSIFISGDTLGSLDGHINNGEVDVFLTKYQLASTNSTPSTGVVTSIPLGSGLKFIPSLGADKIVGTASIDVVQQASTYSNNKLTRLPDGTWQVQSFSNVVNTDTLTNIERVEFTDLTVALDISGLAGQAAKIIGAVFGPSFVSNAYFTGIGLAYLDAGASYKDLATAAANAAGYPSNDALVSALIQNTTGAIPTTAAKNVYLNMLNTGTTLGDLVVSFADKKNPTNRDR